jgi:hypothetical protein
MLCLVNWQKVVGLSEECNASIFRVKRSENSDFCFPQFSRFYNCLNIQQLYNIIQGVSCPPARQHYHTETMHPPAYLVKLLCSGTRYSGGIPIILTGAPPQAVDGTGRPHTHTRPPDIYTAVSMVGVRTDI